MTYHGDEAFPALSDEQWARLQAYGSAQEVESGALLWGAGEATYDLILVDSGEAEDSLFCQRMVQSGEGCRVRLGLEILP
jgi:hypothetical protein